jgi:hypothetical protein
VLLVLTAVLVSSLARMPARYRRLARRGVRSWSDFARRGGTAALANLALPAAVLYLPFRVPAWPALALFQPDLAYWLYAVASVLLVKACVELALVSILFRRGTGTATAAPSGGISTAS